MARNQTNATFSNERWEERPYAEGPGEVKLVIAEADLTYSGDLSAAGAARFLMTQVGQIAVLFGGQEQFTGTLDGRDGSFVVRWVGDDDGSSTHADGMIQPGSGTGELSGIAGTARMTADRVNASFVLTLDWELGS